MSKQAALIHDLTLKVEQLQEHIAQTLGKDSRYYTQAVAISQRMQHTMQNQTVETINHLFELNIIPSIMRLTQKLRHQQQLHHVNKFNKKTLTREARNKPAKESTPPPVALHKVQAKPHYDIDQTENIQNTLKNLRQLLKQDDYV